MRRPTIRLTLTNQGFATRFMVYVLGILRFITHRPQTRSYLHIA